MTTKALASPLIAALLAGSAAAKLQVTDHFLASAPLRSAPICSVLHPPLLAGHFLSSWPDCRSVHRKQLPD